MVKDKASKKDVDVKKPVVKEVPKATYYDKVISRRGKNVTIRTYSDGKREEL